MTDEAILRIARIVLWMLGGILLLAMGVRLRYVLLRLGPVLILGVALLIAYFSDILGEQALPVGGVLILIVAALYFRWRMLGFRRADKQTPEHPKQTEPRQPRPKP